MATMQQNNISEDSLPFSPEEMKAIGEIELGPARHEQFLNKHYKKLIIGLIIFMLLAVAAIVYGVWRHRQTTDGAAAVMAVTKAPTGVVPVSEYDAAALQQIQLKYPGTHAAATAELMRGMQLVDAGQEQEGLAILQSVIANATEPFLSIRAKAYMAGHYMRGGDTQKATELWQGVTQAGASPYQALAYLSLGDLAKQAGDTSMAQLYYKSLIENCPSSPLQTSAEQRLLLLEVDPPVPVAPAPTEDKNDIGELPDLHTQPINLTPALLQ